jgi:hypothetical protein
LLAQKLSSHKTIFTSVFAAIVGLYVVRRGDAAVFG